MKGYYSLRKSFELLNRRRKNLVPTLIIAFIVISSTTVMNGNLGSVAVAAASTTPLPTINTIPSAAPSTISQDGKDSDFTTQEALVGLTARPTNNIVNTNSFYDIVFVTAAPGAIKRIEVTFPAGTTVPSSAFFNEAEGIGPGTISWTNVNLYSNERCQRTSRNKD